MAYHQIEDSTAIYDVQTHEYRLHLNDEDAKLGIRRGDTVHVADDTYNVLSVVNGIRGRSLYMSRYTRRGDGKELNNGNKE